MILYIRAGLYRKQARHSLLSLIMSKHITKPIMGVADAALAMKAGSFDPSTLTSIRSRHDELGQLANIFIEMADTIIAREEHLDGLVQQRTLELEDKNHRLIQANLEAEEALNHLKEAQNHLVESEKWPL